MDIIRERIESVEQDLKQLIADCNREITQLPPGHLLSSTKRGRCYYTQAERVNDVYQRPGISRDQLLISRLARKDFLQKKAATAEADLLLLQNLLDDYQSLSTDDLVQKLCRAAKTLPDLRYLVDGKIPGFPDRMLPLLTRSDDLSSRLERQLNWARADYEQSTYKPEEKIHLTSSGIYVRSKSEASIMEKLFDCGILPRYEQIIYIDGTAYAPDFTFQGASGNLLFWEHAGMMSDPGYARRHTLRMGKFQQAGIVPWKNLIVTYDDYDGGINMGLVNSCIQYQVLPWL